MTTFRTAREISASPDQVFAAFSDPGRLARWWGPAGFSNTFNICEFKEGGQWSYVMHGPDGKHFPNESVFAEIEPAAKVVVPVSWAQTFDSADVASRIEHIVVPANEQNLDRLSDEVLGGLAR